MFTEHSLSGLSQTKWRMECAVVQTEPSSTIKPGPGLPLTYGSVIVKSLSGGEGKSQCHRWDVWKPGVVPGHKSPVPLLFHTANVSGDAWGCISWWKVGLLWWAWRNSPGINCSRSNGGKKWLGTKKERNVTEISVAGSSRESLHMGYWRDLRETLWIQSFWAKDACFSLL